MSPKWNYILGTATIVLIVGGTAYAIKKSIDAKKSEEEGISLAEARELLKKERPLREEMDASIEETIEKVESFNVKPTPINMETFKDDIRDTASFNASFGVQYDPEDNPKVVSFSDDLEECEEDDLDETAADEGYGFYDDVSFDQPLSEYITEEDKQLKYEPNSIQALQQFYKMELAEWVPMSDPYQTLLKLFDFPLVPQNDGDHMLYTKLIEHRVQFFGFNSKWVKEVSFADMILYYARLADYNCGNGVVYWVDYILHHNDFTHLAGSAKLEVNINELNAHTYYNEKTETYGLFGLSEQSMEQALNIASSHVEPVVTYDIEFNELLKSCIG